MHPDSPHPDSPAQDSSVPIPAQVTPEPLATTPGPGYPHQTYPQAQPGYPHTGYPQAPHVQAGQQPQGYPQASYLPAQQPHPQYPHTQYPPAGYSHQPDPQVGYPQPGYGQPGFPGGPAYPQKKQGKGRVVALIAGVVAAVCVGTSVLGVGGYFLLSQPNAGASPKASPTRSKAPVPSPGPGDGVSVAQDWVSERIAESLAKQRTALLAGDQAGYLSIADSKVHTTLKRQFATLRAMQVSSWADDVDQSPYHTPAGDWEANLVAHPCFGVAVCADGPAKSKTKWRLDKGKAVLTGWEMDAHPHPWQISDLVAKVGERTVVATTKNYASKLADLASKAEKAALVADRFARGDKIPTRYVVYYAGPKEWKSWFKWNPPDWSGGVAVHVSKDRYDLVLNGDVLQPSFVDNILRHELTHAASLAGHFGDHDKLWWMIEGIAKVAEMDGIPVSRYPALPYVKELIAKGTAKDLLIDPPKASTAAEEVGGRYGLAFLGMRCIAERHGEEKLVEFFHMVVHDGKKLEVAAPAVLDLEWTALDRECFDYAKQAAR